MCHAWIVSSCEREWCDLIAKKAPLLRDGNVLEPGQSYRVEIDNLILQDRKGESEEKGEIKDERSCQRKRSGLQRKIGGAHLSRLRAQSKNENYRNQDDVRKARWLQDEWHQMLTDAAWSLVASAAPPRRKIDDHLRRHGWIGSQSRARPLNAKQLHVNDQVAYPDIKQDDIWDKSKEDRLAKAINSLQIIYLVIDCIGRAVHGSDHYDA